MPSTAARGAAQDDRAAAREIVKRWQAAIVNVRVVLKMRVSVGGREMQSMDESVETVGTVIDPSGLTVLSLGALNPGSMMNRLMGSCRAAVRIGWSSAASRPTSSFGSPDGRELSARIVLRDEDLDLAFLRPTVEARQAAGRHQPLGRGTAVAARSRRHPVAARPRRRVDAGSVAADDRRNHRKAAHDSTSSRPAAPAAWARRRSRHPARSSVC